MKPIPWIVIPRVLQSARNYIICSCLTSPVAWTFWLIISLRSWGRFKLFCLKKENLDFWNSRFSSKSVGNSFWKYFENVALDSSKIFLQLKLSRFVSIGMQCILELEGLGKLSKLSFNCLKWKDKAFKASNFWISLYAFQRLSKMHFYDLSKLSISLWVQNDRLLLGNTGRVNFPNLICSCSICKENSKFSIPFEA